MGISVETIKKNIKKAISNSPTNITLMRENRIEDGYGGYYLDPQNPYIIIFNEDIYLNELSSNKLNTSYSEGGKVENISGVTAIIPIGNYGIEEGDFFIKEGKKYTINYSVNVYKAYWSADLEVGANVIK